MKGIGSLQLNGFYSKTNVVSTLFKIKQSDIHQLCKAVDRLPPGAVHGCDVVGIDGLNLSDSGIDEFSVFP
jgi:hypothetical protein